MNDQSRSDLLSSAMISMFLVGRSTTCAEAQRHRSDYGRYLLEANAAPWQKPVLRIV